MKKIDKKVIIIIFCVLLTIIIVCIVACFSSYYIYRIDFFWEHETLARVVVSFICGVILFLLTDFFIHMVNKDYFNRIKPTKTIWFRFGDNEENKYTRKKFKRMKKHLNK